MDAEIYAEILKKRGIDPYQQNPKAEYNYCISAFRKDLFAGKVIWTGSYRRDWWNFMRCNHPLIGVFGVPKYHEYSRKERIVVLICKTAIISGVALLSTFTEKQMTANGDPANSIQITSSGISLVGGLSANLMEGIMKFMATCSCVQGISVLFF